ncbi:MAG TPA: HD-GYP domain-containing protein [candidate division Zixibacteria bacterium]|nr:HD-GYP domain-containing protein [candidate division Zixibacteria bacterium]MDD4917310.1 HD-GYP domain-containing protein [candidate division Zixibacteria bacterium]MDM7971542.1 HD-GYP domain-containing protein [candidate division Zixibacteria bacterium]HOD65464.1 HD-GYP domain-containing protein [candidate division Zixibacteria bacterium]
MIESEELKESVKTRLEESGIIGTMAERICHSLLSEKPPGLSPDEYFHLVSISLLELLRARLLASCEPDRLVGPLDRGQLLDYDRILQGLLLTLERDLLRSHLHMIRALGGAIAERDTGTNDHSYRVTIFAVRIAEAMGLPRQTIRSLIKGAFLHDIGKIGIPDAVLIKPGELTPPEREIIKSHVSRGAGIIEVVTWLADAIDVIRYHHERWDGTGYLAGLCGVEIPLTARIFAVADVFDALTSRRPYKLSYNFDQARDMVVAGAGSQFDPDVVRVFAARAEDLYAEGHRAATRRLEEVIRRFIREYFAVEWDRAVQMEPSM